MPAPAPLRQEEPSVREGRPAAVHASRTALRIDLPALVIAALAAVFMAVSGAFGTSTAPFVARLGFWVLTIGIGTVSTLTVAQLLLRNVWLEDRPVRAVLIITLVMGLPLTLISWALSAWTFGYPMRLSTITGAAIPSFAMTLVLTTINLLVGMRQPAVTHAEPPMPGEAPKPVRFLDRLPKKLRGGSLIALQAEDHYLRLHTTAGSDLILMRLSDAIAELDGIEGARTHRSWWVAKDAVQDADKGDGRAVLKLAGGIEAPVSRTYAKALRDAGWF